MDGLDDDLIALARRGGEVFGQQADRRLGVGVGQVEVGVEMTPQSLAQPDHGDHA